MMTCKVYNKRDFDELLCGTQLVRWPVQIAKYPYFVDEMRWLGVYGHVFYPILVYLDVIRVVSFASCRDGGLGANIVL